MTIKNRLRQPTPIANDALEGLELGLGESSEFTVHKKEKRMPERVFASEHQRGRGGSCTWGGATSQFHSLSLSQIEKSYCQTVEAVSSCRAKRFRAPRNRRFAVLLRAVKIRFWVVVLRRPLNIVSSFLVIFVAASAAAT